MALAKRSNSDERHEPERHWFTTMYHPLRVLLLLFLGAGVIAGGCAADATPETVAAAFWQGVIERDVDAIRNTSDLPAATASSIIDDAAGLKTVTFGSMTTADREVVLETNFTFAGEPARTFVSNTYLTRYDTGWMVSYTRTADQFHAQSNLAAAIDSFEQFSTALAAGLEQGVKALEQGLPIVEQQLKTLEREVRENLPALQRRLEEFARRLERAIEPLEDPRPQDQQRAAPAEKPDEPVSI